MIKGLESLKHIAFARKDDVKIVGKELKALIVLKDMLQLKVYKNKLGQCFLEGINILMAIDHETYDLLEEVLL